MTVEKLIKANRDLEIWWDSSPLVYESWLAQMPPGYPGAGFFCPASAPDGKMQYSAESLLHGATTNQPLTWQVIERDPDYWHAWLQGEVERFPGISVQEAMWRLFIEVAIRGADRLAPIFEATDCHRGQICCQVDPRDMTDLDAMLAQARRIHAARPNIMVKMPGTMEGIEGVRILTAEGVPTNVTLGFTLSQLVAVGEAAKAGLKEAHEKGTDLRYWRSCAVMMLGRYEGAVPMQAQAEARGVTLSEAELRWAGIAIFRKAHRIYQERRYPSKLMAASMRLGPTIDGVTRVWHLEKLAGANAVLTVFPNIFEAFMAAYPGIPSRSQVDEPVPDDVLKKLLRIPYFAEAYDESGIAPADWVSHPALQATAASFSQAMEKVEAFAATAVSSV